MNVVFISKLANVKQVLLDYRSTKASENSQKKKTPKTYFSIPTKVYVVPDFVSTSKSKDLFVPALRAKFTVTTSSKRM